MKKIIFLLPILLLLSCSSTTYIKTMPEGAKVYSGDALMGATPYMHWDIDSVDPGNPNYAGRKFTLRKEGYKDKTITIKRDVVNIPRLFFPAPIFSLPWTYDYPYEYFFELEPAGKNKTYPTQYIPNKKEEIKVYDKPYNENARKLLDLRKMRDEGLLTDEEYEQKRKVIIDGI